MEVLTTYHHLQHVIASLLTGRPVLIAGSAKFEGEVSRIINALSVFVGSVRRWVFIINLNHIHIFVLNLVAFVCSRLIFPWNLNENILKILIHHERSKLMRSNNVVLHKFVIFRLFLF